MVNVRWFFVLWLIAVPTRAGELADFAALEMGNQFTASDSLACDVNEMCEDARECLAGLTWAPTEFAVRIERPEAGFGDWLVRFPTPKPIGKPSNDLVALEWYAARDKDGAILDAPAIVVVHESGRHMVVGRIIARGLSSQGVHAFMLHLPGYGARSLKDDLDMHEALTTLTQAIADVRRARDAVVALPTVDDSIVGLQGTSLGGFVAATVAGVDAGFDRVFIMLAGGNIHEVLLNGTKDAARLRKQLERAGVRAEEIVELSRPIEPMRLAHRMSPENVWIYSAKHDEVVPPANSRALATAAGLPNDHHIEMAANHYSGMVYLPLVVQQIVDRMQAVDRKQAE